MSHLRGGIYNIVNVASRGFMDSKGCEETSPTCTRNGSDEGTWTQQWLLVFLEGTSFCKIKSVCSGLYCGVNEVAAGSSILLSASQSIFVVEPSEAKFSIRIPYHDYVLTSGQSCGGAPVILAPRDGSQEQLWDLDYFGLLQSGTYNIINAIQRRALDMHVGLREVIGYPLNRLPHGTGNQQWRLNFLKGTSCCTLQAVDLGLYCCLRDQAASKGSQLVVSPTPAIFSFNPVSNGCFSITIPNHNLALSLRTTGIDRHLETLPRVYVCPYDGADGQLWKLEVIERLRGVGESGPSSV